MSTDRKRGYRRRTDEERIADLERQIQQEKERLDSQKAAERAKRDVNPAIKKIPGLAKHLHKFSQFAVDNGRLDLSNMVTMFLVGLQRIHSEETSKAKGPEYLTEEEMFEMRVEEQQREMGGRGWSRASRDRK